MPLTLSEYTGLVQHLNQLMHGQPQQQVVFHDRPEAPAVDSGPLVASALDRFSISIDRVTGLIEKALAAATPEALTGPQEPAKPKRERKPAATVQGNGPLPSNPLDEHGPQTPAAAPAPAPAPASVSPVPPASAPAAGAGEMPDFLNRAKQTDAGKVSPVPPAAVSPVPPAATTQQGYSEDQVKAVLRQYMNKFGADGPNKLTALLQTYGTTQFSSLPKERWPEIVAKAQQEMML